MLLVASKQLHQIALLHTTNQLPNNLFSCHKNETVNAYFFLANFTKMTKSIKFTDFTGTLIL